MEFIDLKSQYAEMRDIINARIQLVVSSRTAPASTRSTRCARWIVPMHPYLTQADQDRIIEAVTRASDPRAARG